MIKACIFNLNGTIVDKYSLTYILSLKKLFEERDIYLSNSIINKNIIYKKKNIIKNILNDEIIKKQWEIKYNYIPNKYDIYGLNNEYHKIHFDYCKNLITIIPETEECINILNEQNIMIGYNSELNDINTNIIINKLKKNNINFNSNINNIKPENIIRVDNNISTIKSIIGNKNWIVGVSRWSIHMNIYNIHDAYNFQSYELKDKIKESKKLLKDAGADFVIETLKELPCIINKINNNSKSLIIHD